MDSETDLSVPTKTIKGKQKLPAGIRGMIYSFLDYLTLLKKIQGISKKDKSLLLTEILDQERCLRICFSPNVSIKYDQLKFALQVATSYEFYIERMQDVELLPFQMVVSKIDKVNKKLLKNSASEKPIKRMIVGLNFMINV